MSLPGGPAALLALTIVVAQSGAEPTVVHVSADTRAITQAQQSARSTPEPPAGSIRGMITSADDQRPIARVRVVVTSPALSDPRVVLTSADGSFDVPRLPPGTYSMTVSHTGYVAHEHGEPLGSPARVVTLGAGQQINDLVVPLRRAGVLAGVVLDEDGQPLASAIVRALVARTENSRRAFVAVAQGESDDRGRFRLIGLPAGPYYLSGSDPAFDRAGDSTGTLRYGPTYYPGVALAEQATSIDVTPGAEPLQTPTFTVRVVQPVRVSGTIHTQDRRQLQTAAIIMSPIEGNFLGTWPARDVRIRPTGQFVFSNVPPGRYLIRARGEVEVQGTSLFGEFGVTVEGRDVGDIDIVLQPGAIVDGTVVAEAVAGPKAGALSGLRIRTPFLDGSGFGDALTGDVRSDGTFRIRGVMSGTHTIAVEGLRPPWIVKSVVHRGQNIIDVGFTALTNQPLSDLRVTITDVASTVAGTVRNATGGAVANALVIVVPAAQQFWAPSSRHIGVALSDAGGRYEVRGLPDGDYHAAASADLDAADAYSRAVLTTVDRNGARLSLTGIETRTVDLALTPGAILKRSSPQ